MRKFLIGLQSEFDRIAEYQIGRLEPGLSKDRVVSSCRKIVKNVRGFHRSTEQFLSNYLFPLLEDITRISDEDEQELFDTVQKLSSYEVRLDTGLALKIYQGLLEWARAKKDDAKIVKYLYWCGITLHFFRDNSEGILAYFEEGASYADRYDSFEDPDTRKYIHRCLGNQHMMLISKSVNRIEEANKLEYLNYSFWNSIIFSGKDLDFPWLNYFITCLTHRRGHESVKVHFDPDSETKEMRLKLLDTSMTINKLYKKNVGSFNVYGETRYEFMLWEAQFLCGLISFDQLRENINKAKAEIEPGDYSLSAMYVKIQLDTFLMFYAAKMRHLRDRKDEIVSSCMKKVIDYFLSIPMSASLSDVNVQLQFLIESLADIFDPEEQLNFILKMTTYRHIPTYAHSIMVGKIAVCLTKYLINTNPECFVGCMNIASAEEARERSGELCEFAEKSGLCHDIGKITYVSSPYMVTRVLTENELEIVRQHPESGKKMLYREDDNRLNEGYEDVIWGHHKYYDNSDGYPDDFDIAKSNYKMMISIISVADSIDAATDDVGKMYAEGKSLDTVCREIAAGAGSRYSPVVANAAQEVKEELARLLKVERPNAYYTAYLHAWS